MTEPDEIEFHARVPGPTGRSTVVRVGMAAGAALLFLVGVVAVMGASPSPATGADPSASSAPTATPDPAASAAPGTVRPMDEMHGWGGFGMGVGPGRDGSAGFGGFRAITIKAIDGSEISLQTDDGWTRTIAVGATTTITKGGATITVGELAVGDRIRFAQERASDGTYSVTAIVVVLPTIAGQVTAIDGSALTVTQPGGTTATIHVDGATTYRIDGASGSLSDIKVGSFIVAEGAQRADGSLDAAAIRGGDRVPGAGGDRWQMDPKASPAPSTSPG